MIPVVATRSLDKQDRGPGQTNREINEIREGNKLLLFFSLISLISLLFCSWTTVGNRYSRTSANCSISWAWRGAAIAYGASERRMPAPRRRLILTVVAVIAVVVIGLIVRARTSGDG